MCPNPLGLASIHWKPRMPDTKWNLKGMMPEMIDYMAEKIIDFQKQEG